MCKIDWTKPIETCEGDKAILLRTTEHPQIPGFNRLVCVPATAAETKDRTRWCNDQGLEFHPAPDRRNQFIRNVAEPVANTATTPGALDWTKPLEQVFMPETYKNPRVIHSKGAGHVFVVDANTSYGFQTFTVDGRGYSGVIQIVRNKPQVVTLHGRYNNGERQGWGQARSYLDTHKVEIPEAIWNQYLAPIK